MNAANVRTLIISATVIIVAVIIYLLVRPINNHPRIDEQVPVKCGSETVYRYKYPSEFFPVFAQDYNTQVSLTSDILHRVQDSMGSAQVGVDVKSEIVQLQEQLNQDNITFSTALRTYFINSNSEPCNDTLRRKFLDFTDEMAKRVLDLKNTTTQIATIEKPASMPTETAPATSQSNSSTPPIDSGKVNLPIYSIIRDTGKIKTSLYRFDEILRNNKKFNSRLKL